MNTVDNQNQSFNWGKNIGISAAIGTAIGAASGGIKYYFPDVIDYPPDEFISRLHSKAAYEKLDPKTEKIIDKYQKIAAEIFDQKDVQGVKNVALKYKDTLKNISKNDEKVLAENLPKMHGLEAKSFVTGLYMTNGESGEYFKSLLKTIWDKENHKFVNSSKDIPQETLETVKRFAEKFRKSNAKTEAVFMGVMGFLGSMFMGGVIYHNNKKSAKKS